MVSVQIMAGGKTIATTPAEMIAASALARAGARAPAREGHHPKSKEAVMAEADTTEDKGSIAAQELRLFVERIERLEEEIKGINDDKKEIYSEMKGRGYDPKIVKKLLAIRRKKKGEHEEEAMVLETYMAALGMI